MTLLVFFQTSVFKLINRRCHKGRGIRGVGGHYFCRHFMKVNGHCRLLGPERICHWLFIIRKLESKNTRLLKLVLVHKKLAFFDFYISKNNRKRCLNWSQCVKNKVFFSVFLIKLTKCIYSPPPLKVTPVP